MPAKPLLLVEALAARNDSGLGNMARLFVDGLRGLADAADILVLLPKEGGYRPGGHCRVRPVAARPWRLWTEAVFPALILRHRPAAVLCLGQSLPRLRPPASYVLAVPDVGPLEDLGMPASSHDAYNRAWLKRRAPKADRILAISRFTQGRISALLGYPAERIDVVHPIRPAALTDIAGEADPGSGREGTHPPGAYFLTVGNVEPRKNHPGLIAGYAALASRCPEVPPLYIAGHSAWGRREAEAAVGEHNMRGKIHFVGYLADADRRAYLAHCTAYVSASLYEGWGLPLFEALSLGVPAVYHAGTSQEEFARGMAVATDCRDPLALSAALEKVWRDEARRSRLRAAMAADMPRLRHYDLEGALRAALLPLLRVPSVNPPAAAGRGS